MFRFSLIPWEYGVRNLFRRPMRTLLTLTGLTTVIVLVFVVIGFIRGLEHSLTVSGDPQVALLFSLGMGENLEYSSIPMRTSELVSASVAGIKTFHDRKYVSPELYLGTQIEIPDQQETAMGLVRGVTQSALLVRRQVQLESGSWPGPGEIMTGQLAATKLDLTNDQMAAGKELIMEGRTWRISGTFSAAGSAFESEIWCRLDELQQAMKRQDLSLVAVTLNSPSDYPDLDLFCKERLDLELQSIREVDYYQGLKKDYGPIRLLAWLVVFLVSGAGVFAGLNTLYGAVVGRTRELSTLQTLGFLRRAIVISLIQEGVLLATAASLIAALIAVFLINGVSVRFTMGAFSLQIDSISLLIGCGVGILLGLLGAIPPALRALRLPVIDGLKSV
ncbi:MAG: ABC transporter permease [Planctomycetota bacterium]|uniref:ABC transporter permease n=1 Tax=uncultured Gimesia sp. TaxID=1678688 RepID=UPI0026185646|nr:ABC transporter permease [uncultured Gimesia sp.]